MLVVEKIVLALIMVVFSSSIMRIKLKKLQESTDPTLTPEFISLKVEYLCESFESSKNMQAFIYKHRQECNAPQCPCFLPSVPDVYLFDSLLEHEYVMALHKASDPQVKRTILAMYLEFLVRKGQDVRAMAIIAKHGAIGSGETYWAYCQIKQNLLDKMDSKQYFSSSYHKFEILENFDLMYGYMLKEIREILMQKCEFWQEVCLESPHISILHEKGHKIIDKVENLHEFYMYKVRESEEALQNYKCSCIYIEYLFRTTTHKEFARSLIKKYNRNIEEIQIDSENGQEFGLFLDIDNNSFEERERFELTIKNISSELCLLLKREKLEILHKNVSEIIPNGFRTLHDLGFDKYIRNVSFIERNSCILGAIATMPFQIDSTLVAFLEVETCIRYCIYRNKPMVHCLLRKKKNTNNVFITNFKGELVYYENSEVKSLSESDEIRKLLEKLEHNMKEGDGFPVIEEQCIINQNILGVKCIAFFYKGFLSIKQEPLIKVVIEGNINKVEKVLNEVTKNDFQFESPEFSPLEEHNASSQKSGSQTSSSSRKDTVEGLLNSLNKINSLKKSPLLTITILFIACFAIVSFITLKNEFQTWSNEKKEQTPTFAIMEMINMQRYFSFCINHNYDAEYNFTNPETLEKIKRNLHQGYDAKEYADVFVRSLFLSQKVPLFEIIFGNDFYGHETFFSLIQRNIEISNSKHPELGSQNMTLQSLLLNLMTSTYTSPSEHPFSLTLLSSSFLPHFYGPFLETITSMQSLVTSHMEGFYTLGTIVIFVLGFVLLVLFLPLFLFNYRTKKDKLKVYNLLANLSVSVVANEVVKLINVSYKLKNANITHQSFYLELPDKQKEVKNEYHAYLKNVRKRNADLVVKGSPCDQKRVTFCEIIPIIFVLGFYFICLSFHMSKKEFATYAFEHYEKTMGVVSYLEKIDLGLINTKEYTDHYTLDNKIIFCYQDLEQWVKKFILNTNFPIEAEIGVETLIQKCSNNTNIICNNSFSFTLFRSLIMKSISDGFEKKKQYLEFPSEFTLLELEKAREFLIYTTEIQHQFSTIYDEWLLESFNTLERDYKIHMVKQGAKEKLFWAFLALYFVFGFFYISYRKNESVKEIVLLSLLGEEMIEGNKSIESFIRNCYKD